MSVAYADALKPASSSEEEDAQQGGLPSPAMFRLPTYHMYVAKFPNTRAIFAKETRSDPRILLGGVSLFHIGIDNHWLSLGIIILNFSSLWLPTPR